MPHRAKEIQLPLARDTSVPYREVTVQIRGWTHLRGSTGSKSQAVLCSSNTLRCSLVAVYLRPFQSPRLELLPCQASKLRICVPHSKRSKEITHSTLLKKSRSPFSSIHSNSLLLTILWSLASILEAKLETEAPSQAWILEMWMNRRWRRSKWFRKFSCSNNN